ncbi:RNA-directed DNA polymerase, eukaryota, partial [Tanacetum coccineum]
MESLHISVSKAVNEGVIKGLSIQGSDPISHLFYADDAVFLGEWSEENLVNLVRIIDCFYLASGLKINLHKSKILGVGVPKEIVDQGASLIGCEVLSTPFTYLGVTVGDKMTRRSAWLNTVQKIKARLSKWKSKTLSVGGRVTLLKSVLGAVPLYTMSLYKAPKGVLHEMESLRSNFFKGVNQNDIKISWVAWDKVLASKKQGGLGISSMFALNRGLILKWVWRFLSQDGSIWSRVIKSIYGPYIDSHVDSFPSNWCSILREVKVLSAKGFDFFSHCKKKVGNGRNSRFWLDTWLLDKPFRVRFPRLFILEMDKTKSVAAKWDDPSFCSSFRRPVRDGIEKEQWLEMLSMLDTVMLSSSIDRWVCDLNGEGDFRVKDVRSSLDELFLPSMDVATRWVKFVPKKINVFAWRARLDRLPTRLNLIKRGVILDSDICPICNSSTEDSSHIFFHCDMAKSILRKISIWWDIPWRDCSSFTDWVLKSVVRIKIQSVREAGCIFQLSCLFPCRTDRDSNKEKMVVSSEDSNGQGSCGAVFARWLVAVEGGERDIEMVVGDCEDDDGVKDGARVSICVPSKNAIGDGNDNDNENGIRDLETVEHDKVVLDQDDEANDYQDCYNVQQNEVGQDQDYDNVQNYEVGQDLNQENVQRCEVGQDQTQEHVQKDDMGRNEDQENMQKDMEKK